MYMYVRDVWRGDIVCVVTGSKFPHRLPWEGGPAGINLFGTQLTADLELYTLKHFFRLIPPMNPEPRRRLLAAVTTSAIMVSYAVAASCTTPKDV